MLKSVVNYDSHGNLTLEEVYMSIDNETWEQVAGSRYDYTYTSDGIRAVSSEDSTAATIYNLQGVAQNADFDSLPAGIYVVKTARQARKIVKR